MALPPEPTTAVQELKRRFPLWSVSVSGLGRWWAIREDDQLRPGCSVIVSADHLHDLEAELVDQESLRARLLRRERPSAPAVEPSYTTPDIR